MGSEYNHSTPRHRTRARSFRDGTGPAEGGNCGVQVRDGAIEWANEAPSIEWDGDRWAVANTRPAALNQISIRSSAAGTRGPEADVARDRGPLSSALATYRLHGVVKDILRDRRSQSLTIVGRRSEVNARKDAGVLHFVERRRKAVKRTNDTGHHVRFHTETSPFAEIVRQHGASGPAEGAMPPRFTGSRWRSRIARAFLKGGRTMRSAEWTASGPRPSRCQRPHATRVISSTPLAITCSCSSTRCWRRPRTSRW